MNGTKCQRNVDRLLIAVAIKGAKAGIRADSGLRVCFGLSGIDRRVAFSESGFNHVLKLGQSLFAAFPHQFISFLEENICGVLLEFIVHFVLAVV